MRDRLRGPTLPVLGGGAIATPLAWSFVGAWPGIVTLLASVLLACTPQLLEFLRGRQRDSYASQFAMDALQRDVEVDVVSSAQGLEMHVRPNSKGDPRV